MWRLSVDNGAQILAGSDSVGTTYPGMTHGGKRWCWTWKSLSAAEERGPVILGTAASKKEVGEEWEDILLGGSGREVVEGG